MTIDFEEDMTWAMPEERLRWQKYESMTDDQVLAILREQAAGLDHLPAKYEVPDAAYFKRRFGPWPRVLERAGLKPVSEQKQRRRDAELRKRQENRRRVREKKQNQMAIPPDSGVEIDENI